MIRRGEAMPLPSTDADYSAALLSACPPHARRDVFLVHWSRALPASPSPIPSARSSTSSSRRGSLRLTIDGESIDLDPGDYARHAGDSVHAYEALTPDTMAVCIVEAS